MRTLGFVVAFSSLAALSAVACGSTSSGTTTPPVVADDAGVDAEPVAEDAAPPVDNGAPSTTYPAPHPPLPTKRRRGAFSALPGPQRVLHFHRPP